MTENMMLRKALKYAAADWPVFPCSPGGKLPLFPTAHPQGDPLHGTCKGACGRVGHGLYDATTDIGTITAWWTRTPGANVAIATGRGAPDVLDFDVKRDAPGRKTYRRLAEAGLLRGTHTIVSTPSGGFHLYYLGTEQGNASIAKHGVDLRSAGGYVLAPPSLVDGRPYALREWRSRYDGKARTVDMAAVRRLLDPPRPAATAAFQSRSGDHGALVRHVAGQGAGNRNNALFWAACKAAETGAGDDVFAELLDAAMSTGLTMRAAMLTIDSARNRAAVAA